MLTHQQTLESLLIAFGPAGGLESRSFGAIALEHPCIEADSIGGGLLVKREFEPGGPNGI